jgi:hypothetical protein
MASMLEQILGLGGPSEMAYAEPSMPEWAMEDITQERRGMLGNLAQTAFAPSSERPRESMLSMRESGYGQPMGIGRVDEDAYRLLAEIGGGIGGNIGMRQAPSISPRELQGVVSTRPQETRKYPGYFDVPYYLKGIQSIGGSEFSPGATDQFGSRSPLEGLLDLLRR